MTASNATAALGLDEAFLRRLERLRIAVRRDRAGRDAGSRRSPVRGSSVEFADFRSYSMGDDIRRIDWAAYARLERLFLRLYHEDRNATVHLLLDVSPSMDWGGGANKLIWAKRLVAALGYVALSELDRVSLTPVAGGTMGRTHPYSGAHAVLRFFEQVAGLPIAAEPTNLDVALRGFGGRPAGPVILISDLLVSGWGSEGLRALQAARHEVAVIHVLAPDEIYPTERGDLRLRDRETGQTREVTIDEGLLARYQTSLAAWRAEVREGCHARRIAYVPARSDDPIDDVVFGVLRRERVVA